MAAYNKFNQFVQYLCEGKINFASDTFKVMLTNTAPVATNSVYGDISGNELANGAGYTTGGAAVTISSEGQTGGTENVVASAANPTWTASGSMGPFRYVVVYDSSAATQALVCFFDFGSSLTLSSGDTFTVSFDATNGLFQLS